jgi:hypothetical protein
MPRFVSIIFVSQEFFGTTAWVRADSLNGTFTRYLSATGVKSRRAGDLRFMSTFPITRVNEIVTTIDPITAFS